MAIMDKYLEFCDAEALSTAVIASATTTMGNVIELAKAKNPNSGKGTSVYLHLKVSTALGSGGSATIAFNLEHAATNSPASFSVVAGLLPATAVATYAAGYELNTIIPSMTLKRFIRLKYAVAVTRLTGGAIDAWIDLADDG